MGEYVAAMENIDLQTAISTKERGKKMKCMALVVIQEMMVHTMKATGAVESVMDMD